jgi:hypothetical protein
MMEEAAVWSRAEKQVFRLRRIIRMMILLRSK